MPTHLLVGLFEFTRLAAAGLGSNATSGLSRWMFTFNLEPRGRHQNAAGLAPADCYLLPSRETGLCQRGEVRLAPGQARGILGCSLSLLGSSRLEVNLRRDEPDEPGGIQLYLIKYCECVDEMLTTNTSLNLPQKGRNQRFV